MGCASSFAIAPLNAELRHLRIQGELGAYVLLRPLGDGAFSEVWVCADELGGTTHACKVVLKSAIAANPTLAKKILRREVRALSTLQHPCIRVFEE